MSPRLKWRLKRLAKWLGMTARHITPISRDMAGFCRHLSAAGYNPLTIIDVGVADGTLDLYDCFPDADLVLVEPATEFKPAIDQILARRRGECFYVAAGPSDGETLMVAPDDNLIAMHNFRTSGRGRRVPMRRLDTIIDGRPGPFLLKVDVEGTEPDVVDGAAGLIAQTDVIILEIRFMDMLGGTPIAHEVIAHMARLGYVIYDIFSTFGRPLDGAMVLCDMAFVRQDSDLLKDGRWATENQTNAHGRKLSTRLRQRLAA